MHLIGHCRWNIQHENGELILVARNCVRFRPFRDDCYVTLIDGFFYIEVHVKGPPPSCIKHCPTIREQILDGVNAVCKVLKYINDHPHMAFFCPHSDDTETKSKQDRHAATISEDGNYFSCTMSDNYFHLDVKHKLWLKGQGLISFSLLIHFKLQNFNLTNVQKQSLCPHHFNSQMVPILLPLLPLPFQLVRLSMCRLMLKLI